MSAVGSTESWSEKEREGGKERMRETNDNARKKFDVARGCYIFHLFG